MSFVALYFEKIVKVLQVREVVGDTIYIKYLEKLNEK